MGLFNTILSKLGLGKKEEEAKAAPAPAAPAPKPAIAAAPVKPAAAAPAPAKPATPVTGTAAKTASAAPVMEKEDSVERITSDKPVVAPAVKAISEVDVVKQLEQMAEGSGLDWKVSIVDLLKVLKIDSSLEARKGLAEELGCPAELMGGDHSKMNIWLHKTVLKKIAENGGNIPANLLD